MADTPLARRRRAAGLSQAQLAQLVGLRQPDISKLETGRHAPAGVRHAVRLAAALETTVEALWGSPSPTAGPLHQPGEAASGRTGVRWRARSSARKR